MGVIAVQNLADKSVGARRCDSVMASQRPSTSPSGSDQSHGTSREHERIRYKTFWPWAHNLNVDAQGGTEMTKGGNTPAPYSMKYTQAGMKHYPGYGKTVNTFLPNTDSQFYGAASTLNSSEALCVAITRAINSGAPVNNMSLYQEINWNLNNMGFESVQPIEIKESLKAMIKK